MFEYLGALFGMHQVDGIISSAHAKESQKPQVVQMGPPGPAYRVTREQRFEAIRKRFERQSKEDERTPDPYRDMWDPNWINKKD